MWAHKLRAFLTMFGIAWGVGSLLLLVGLGEGFRAGTEKSLASFGEDYMQIYNGRVPAVGSSQLSSRQYYLDYQDYLDIRNSPFVRNATPVIYRGDLRLVSEYGSSNGYVDGAEPQFYDIRRQPVDQGRWLNWTDEQQRNNVCVIGSEFVRILFPGRPVIGSRILINSVPFEVVGTIASIGHGNNNSQNMRLVMPYATMGTYFPMMGQGNANALKYVAYQPVTREQHQQARKAVHSIVARNHRFDPETPDAFDDWDSIATAEMVGKISNAMDAFLGAVGLVTLGLGAMGVVNIMLVSVAERTREIGLRKALGATRRSILFQFFLEGLMLTVISGGDRSGCGLRCHEAFRTGAADRWVRTASHLSGDGGTRRGKPCRRGHCCRTVSRTAGSHAHAGRGASPGVTDDPTERCVLGSLRRTAQ